MISETIASNKTQGKKAYRERTAAPWVAVVIGIGLLGPAGPVGATPAADPGNTVLILGPTVSGGAASDEAVAATNLGFTVEVVTDAAWAAKSAADFQTYRAIVLGDPTCISLSPATVAAATANAASWGPLLDGNIVLIGTDEVFHRSQGGLQLTTSAVAFATDEVGKLGAMISLSCYYHGTAPSTPIPLLDGINAGGFTTTGVGCFNNVHIVATSPALAGTTDASLSGWGCSVHEAFDSWPPDFQVLAIAQGIGSVFTAPDGSIGTPYILARGNITPIGLVVDPLAAENPVGTSHMVTATIVPGDPNDPPPTGELINFSVIAGPNIGAPGICNPLDCRTTGAGEVMWTYTDTGGPGVDSIQVFWDQDESGGHDIGEPIIIVAKTWVVPPEFCGDNVVNLAGEQCDGTDDATCPGLCHPPGHPNECGCPAHYQCYESDRQPKYPGLSGLTLADQFSDEDVNLRRRKRFCNPANKNDEDPTAIDDADHLTGYTLRHGDPFEQVKNVRVINQFGDITVDVVRPELLLVPTAKDLGMPAVPLVGPAVDHFQCYKIRRARTRVRGVKVVDQFGELTVDVKKPVSLCAPVDKNGEGILDPRVHMMCYRIRSTPRRQFSGIPFWIANQLEETVTSITRPTELCVPSVL